MLTVLDFQKKKEISLRSNGWKKMIKFQKHILFFDFLQKHFPSHNILNVVKKNFVKEDKTIVKSSRPPLENILIDCKWVTVKGSPFKSTSDVPPENRKIIEQNNFVNQSLHTIGQQLDCIEEKICPTSVHIEKPLISLPEKRKSLGLKTNSQKKYWENWKNAFWFKNWSGKYLQSFQNYSPNFPTIF